jgi:aldose 1-epimerase
MRKTDFGKRKTDNEAEVSLFTIEHSAGSRTAVTDLGASLVSLEIPDQSGRMGDVVLGFRRAEDYAAHAGFYFGSSVGRLANCIAHSKFALGGRVHQIATNNSPGAGRIISTVALSAFTSAFGT